MNKSVKSLMAATILVAVGTMVYAQELAPVGDVQSAATMQALAGLAAAAKGAKATDTVYQSAVAAALAAIANEKDSAEMRTIVAIRLIELQSAVETPLTAEKVKGWITAITAPGVNVYDAVRGLCSFYPQALIDRADEVNNNPRAPVPVSVVVNHYISAVRDRNADRSVLAALIAAENSGEGLPAALTAAGFTVPEDFKARVTAVKAEAASVLGDKSKKATPGLIGRLQWYTGVVGANKFIADYNASRK